MNPNPPQQPYDGDDAAFLASLQRLSLRPPPPASRDAILTAASSVESSPVRAGWHRSPFWRTMAALWAVLLLLAGDTWRLAPSLNAASTGTSPAPMDASEVQSLLASLNRLQPPRPRNY